MEYKGKLYGHLGGKRYFDTGKTADDWDNLEKRIAELEAENKALSMSGVEDSPCDHSDWHFINQEIARCRKCGNHF